MAMLLMVMEDLVVGEVVNYRGEPVYADKELNNMWIGLDIEELQLNKFQEHVAGLFPQDVEEMILYRSYCNRTAYR